MLIIVLTLTEPQKKKKVEFKYVWFLVHSSPIYRHSCPSSHMQALNSGAEYSGGWTPDYAIKDFIIIENRIALYKPMQRCIKKNGEITNLNKMYSENILTTNKKQ